MRILKSTWFQRFAVKNGIEDSALRSAVARAQAGQIDADLGGGVIKQRVARPGQGKSAGYRVIVVFRRGSLAVFVYGFAKSKKSNLERDEEVQFKQAAKHILALTGPQLVELVRKGSFVEVK